MPGPFQLGTSINGGASSRDPLFKLRTDDFVFGTNTLHDGVRWGKSSNFTQTPILNRSSPIITYANSNPIMLSVTLNLFVTNGDNDLDSGPNYVFKILESITSFTFPTNPGIAPPTLCYVTLATSNLFDEWPCVMPNFESTYGTHNIWTDQGAPMSGTVNLQFMGVEISNRKASDIVKAGNYTQFAFRGASSPGISGAGT